MNLNDIKNMLTTYFANELSKGGGFQAGPVSGSVGFSIPNRAMGASLNFGYPQQPDNGVTGVGFSAGLPGGVYPHGGFFPYASSNYEGSQEQSIPLFQKILQAKQAWVNSPTYQAYANSPFGKWALQ